MIGDASITQLSHSLAAVTKDLKKFKEDQPALARKRKQEVEEVKRTGTIDSETRRSWLFAFERLEGLMRQLQEFDMVWKDTSALVAKLGTDLKKDVALVEAVTAGSDGAVLKAQNLLRQQADLLEAVVKRSQLLKSDLKPLFEQANRDGDLSPEDRKRIPDILQRSTKQIEETLQTFENNLKGRADTLRYGLE